MVAQFELGPRDRAPESHHEVVGRDADLTRWLGRRIVAEMTCAPITERSTRFAGFHRAESRPLPNPEPGRPARPVPIELTRRVLGDLRSAFVARDSVEPAYTGGATTAGSATAPRETTRVVAGVRHHADFGLRYLGVGLDPVDQRRAARRGREQTLEDDQPRVLLEDRLERLNRLRIGKRQKLSLVARRSRSDGVRLRAAMITEGEDTISVYHAAETLFLWACATATHSERRPV